MCAWQTNKISSPRPNSGRLKNSNVLLGSFFFCSFSHFLKAMCGVCSASIHTIRVPLPRSVTIAGHGIGGASRMLCHVLTLHRYII